MAFIQTIPRQEKAFMNAQTVTYAQVSSQSLVMGNVLNFENNLPFTLMTWFKSASALLGLTFISKQNQLSPKRGYRIHSKNALTLSFEFYNTITTNAIEVEYTGGAVPMHRDGSWHNIIVTYDGTKLANGVVVYLDNAILAPTVITDTLTATTLNTDDLSVGSRNGTDKFMDGNLTQSAIFDNKLTVAQVAEIAVKPVDLTKTSMRDNLVGWWGVDGSVFPTINDNSNNNNSGTMTNMVAGNIVNDAP